MSEGRVRQARSKPAERKGFDIFELPINNILPK